MLSKKMTEALNQQINAEFYSSFLYLSMASYFTGINLAGAANWMQVQTKEENAHAVKMYNFMLERNGKVELRTIDGPPTKWDSPLDAFKDAYKHEQKVTAMINDLVNLAIEEKDHATNAFLQWYVNEQVEEESNVDGVVQKLKLIKDAPGAIFMVDQELAARVFVDPLAKPGA